MSGVEFLPDETGADAGLDEVLRAGAAWQSPGWARRGALAGAGALVLMASLLGSSASVPAPPPHHRAPFYQPYFLPWRGNALL